MGENKPRYIACPKCGDVIGEYNPELEEERKEKSFKSYCGGCQTAVTPLYLN